MLRYNLFVVSITGFRKGALVSYVIFARVEVMHLFILFVAGIVAAFISTVSAAGSLISLSALMLCGLSPTEANATNRIPVIFQSFFSAKGFESRGLKSDAYRWWLAVVCVPGAIIGALFAVKIPEDVFNKILGGVLLLFLVLTIVNPLKVTGEAEERLELKHKMAGTVLYFIVGFFGGFIQTGAGFFLMVPALLLHRFNLSKTNYYKVSITLIYTIAALAIFIWKGNIHWYYGLVMGAGTSLGGWLTSRWSVTMDESQMKWLMVSLILFLTIYTWFFKQA